jgi:predicted Zn-dependent protease
MPLEQPDRRHCQAAAGYAELGMFLEANTELDKIDPFNRAAPEVLALRIGIYRGLEKWELMQQIARRLADFQPDDIAWTISLAYATRRADSIQEAKNILLSAESKFPKEASIRYNLACYYCQLGDVQNAKRYLKKAFEIDSKWRIAALQDEDLKLLWESI